MQLKREYLQNYFWDPPQDQHTVVTQFKVSSGVKSVVRYYISLPLLFFIFLSTYLLALARLLKSIMNHSAICLFHLAFFHMGVFKLDQS